MNEYEKSKLSGTVKFFREDKGYGFVVWTFDGQRRETFFHIRDRRPLVAGRSHEAPRKWKHTGPQPSPVRFPSVGTKIEFELDEREPKPRASPWDYSIL